MFNPSDFLHEMNRRHKYHSGGVRWRSQESWSFDSVTEVPLWPWLNFMPAEVACRGTGKVLIVPEFMDRVQILRDIHGNMIRVSSWYRTPEHNASVSKTGLDGPHTTGRALDILCSGATAWKLLTIAGALGFTGCGVNQKGEYSDRFVHLDDLTQKGHSRPRPHMWSY